MSEQGDGVDEALESMLRIALTVAGRVAERVAREREQQLRDAQAASEQEARELQNRLDAQRQAARAALSSVEAPEWWDRAQPEQIAEAWQLANEWKHTDPAAAQAVDEIGQQLRDRYEIDVDDLRGDPAAVRDALQRREQDLQTAAEQRARGAREQTEAQLLMRDSDHAHERGEPAEATTQQDAAHERYDSAERRTALAASLEGVADQETIEARVIADTHRGRVRAVGARQGQRRGRPHRRLGPQLRVAAAPWGAVGPLRAASSGPRTTVARHEHKRHGAPHDQARARAADRHRRGHHGWPGRERRRRRV